MIERWILSIDLVEVLVGFILGNVAFFVSTVLTDEGARADIKRKFRRGFRPIKQLWRWMKLKASKKIRRYKKKKKDRLKRAREQWYDIQQQSYFEAMEDGRKPW